MSINEIRRQRKKQNKETRIAELLEEYKIYLETLTDHELMCIHRSDTFLIDPPGPRKGIDIPRKFID